MSTFDVAEYESYHNRLRIVRKQLGLNQADVSAQVEIAQGRLSQFESGKAEPTDEQRAALDAFYEQYGVPRGWLSGAPVTAASDVTELVALPADFDSREFCLRIQGVIHDLDILWRDLWASAPPAVTASHELLSTTLDLPEGAPSWPDGTFPAGGVSLADAMLAQEAAASVALDGETQAVETYPGQYPGQVTVEEVVEEATNPVPVAQFVMPGQVPQPAPFQPAEGVGQFTQPAPVATLPPVAAPFVPTVDPIAAIIGGTPEPAAPAQPVQELAYPTPPATAAPAPIDVILGFAQPVSVDA